MTSVILPNYILSLFEKEVNDIVKKAIKKVCDEYDIDFNDAQKLVDVNLQVKNDNIRIIKKNILNKNPHPPEIRCLARMLHEVEIKQCSRRKDKCDFCGTHQKMFKNGTLKYGKITDPVPLALNDKVLSYKEKRKLY